MEKIHLPQPKVNELHAICKEHDNDPGELINILHAAQEIFGYLPREVQEMVAAELHIPVSRVYGVVTFYSFFTMTPKGKYPIPASIQEYLENTDITKDYHIKIQLTDIGVKLCESECLLASELKPLPTGGGIIDMEINHSALKWVADYILPFGNNATVLEPVELIELMQQKIYELHQHYCKSEV